MDGLKLGADSPSSDDRKVVLNTLVVDVVYQSQNRASLAPWILSATFSAAHDVLLACTGGGSLCLKISISRAVIPPDSSRAHDRTTAHGDKMSLLYSRVPLSRTDILTLVSPILGAAVASPRADTAVFNIEEEALDSICNATTSEPDRRGRVDEREG